MFLFPPKNCRTMYITFKYLPKYHLKFTCKANNIISNHCTYWLLNPRKHPKNIKMENLPVEVLEIVFCQMSKMEDIQMCLNTNSKWRKIIENMWA